MSKQLMRAMNVFAEITRVNEEDRTVEAYAFVNEVVEGEGGLRLKRSAMEAATPDYMKWANVREMHRASAAGVAQCVDWDDKGAKMVLEVVDDDAWNKVKRGVYKGLSVGVAPVVMRGKDVEKCRWIETSLVDRPKDPDAVITAVRADDAADEYEVEIIEERAEETEEVERGAFADAYKKHEGSRLRYFATDLLQSMLWDIQNGNSATKEEDARAIIKDFGNIYAPLCARGEIEDPAMLTRFCSLDAEAIERMETPADGFVTRAEFDALYLERNDFETRLTEALTRVERAEAEVVVLKNQPAPKPIAKSGVAAIDRTFLANAQEEETQRVETLKEELKRCETLPADATPEQRVAASNRIGAIRRELTGLGVTL